jgi:hypothetical protein
MAKSKKSNKTSKPASVKVQDLEPEKNPRGGRKAGEQPIEYLKIKLTDVLIS